MKPFQKQFYSLLAFIRRLSFGDEEVLLENDQISVRYSRGKSKTIHLREVVQTPFEK